MHPIQRGCLVRFKTWKGDARFSNAKAHLKGFLATAQSHFAKEGLSAAPVAAVKAGRANRVFGAMLRHLLVSSK